MAILKNTVIDSTGYLQLPVGNTLQRPANATNGMIRFNSDTSSFEVFNAASTAWNTVGAGPTISQIQITDNSYNVLDDTAVSTDGGYIKITGSGFSAGAVVIIGNVNATSTTVISNTVLNVQVPAAVSGTYTVYVVNSGGGTAIGVNGLTYSALPNWITGSTLPSGVSDSPINIQLNATDATSFVLAEGNTLPSGLTLTSGGLLSGTVTIGAETTYSFTVIAIDNELQDSPRAFTITITVGDPYFYLTTLLLPGNGTNNQNNNVFLDSSNNNFTITRNGNTTQGTFSPFSQTGWSAYFDGADDRIQFTNQATTGSFTCECWFYGTGNPSGGYHILFGGPGTTGATNTQFTARNDGGVGLVLGSTIVASSSGTPFAINRWNHIAYVRSGTSCAIFVNGARVATGTSSAALNCDRIGGQFATYEPIGYISNARITTAAVYDPSLTTYTVPTAPLTAGADIYLLTLQTNRFVDNRANPLTLTVNGNPTIQAFSPFDPTSAWSAATNGGSGYFDGSGDYLETTNSSGLNGTGNFTIEFWYYPITNTGMLFNSRAGGTGGDGIDISTTLNITTASVVYFSSATINLNSWTHVAIVRNGGNLLRYINGTLQGTSAIAANFDGTTFRIGGNTQGNAGYLTGYISNFRVTNNAVYTSAFTPPTAPLTNIANTSLLLNFTNAGIYDATSKNILETVGDAKISTIQSKFGGSSILFDGTGDWLFIRSNPLMNFGTGDFTIEFWMYPVASTGDNGIWDSRNADLSATGFTVSYTDNEKIQFYSDTQKILGTTTVSLNTWTHIAVTRSGTFLRLFVNGVLDGNVSNSQNFTDTNITIGRGVWSNSEFEGYIDDFRVTKGYARYTANFTPPTGAFPPQ